jgi:two-component system chemotaxis response regulator CheB
VSVEPSRRIRVLVVDDSPTMAGVLVALLREDPLIEVVAQAESGERAVNLARLLRPDVITMDLMMPGLDGPSAIESVMAEAPCRVLVVSAVERAREVDLGIAAMAAGALDIIAKPRGNAEALRAWGRQLAHSVRLMSEIPVVTRRGPRLQRVGVVPPTPAVPSTRASAVPGAVAVPPEVLALRASAVPGAVAVPPEVLALRGVPTPPRPTAASRAAPRPAVPPAPVPAPKSKQPAEVLALVSSTGGPVALAQILAALPGALPVPVVVAQHMTPGFTAGMVRWFSGVSRLTIQVAQDGEALRAGHVYFAPDGMDLEVGPGGRAAVAKNLGGHCPSGDRLLHSLVKAYGGRIVAAVLTGMGDDGARGLLAIRQAGGATLAQDEASSVVYGMPRVAHELGGAEEVLALPLIAARLEALCNALRAPTLPPHRTTGS